MEKPATDGIEVKCSIPKAIDMMYAESCTHAEYADILKKILATGYDINANNSELLLRKLTQKTASVDSVILLFSLGAQVASAQSVYNHTVYGSAFTGGRVYHPNITRILLDHQ